MEGKVLSHGASIVHRPYSGCGCCAPSSAGAWDGEEAALVRKGWSVESSYIVIEDEKGLRKGKSEEHGIYLAI